MTPQSKIDAYLKEYKNASKAELRQRLATLKAKSKTAIVIAEIKAIQALLA
jgi:hypothetical protein